MHALRWQGAQAARAGDDAALPRGEGERSSWHVHVLAKEQWVCDRNSFVSERKAEKTSNRHRGNAAKGSESNSVVHAHR